MKINSYILIVVLFVVSSLDAFSILGLPIEWIYIPIYIFLGLFLINKSDFSKLKYLKIWGLFIIISLVLTCLFILHQGGNLNSFFVSNTNTDYWVYILLRYLILILPIITIILFGNLSVEQYERLKNVIVIWGTIIALYAVYVYIAVLYDLPTIPKTRTSTSGGEQKTIYTNYIINRATGTFREPSFIGTWLLLPFFVSLKYKSGKIILFRIVIILAILLTGSLSAYIALSLTILLFFVLKLGKEKNGFPFKKIVKFASAILSSIIIVSSTFYLFDNLINVNINKFSQFLFDRIEPLLQGINVTQTNRAEPYLYLYENGLPWIGYGPGNANLLLSRFKGTQTVSSFHSLYLNYIYAVGLIFSPIFLSIFAYPVWLCFKKIKKISPHTIAVFVAMLLVASVLNQEFSIVLIFSLCFVLYESKKNSFQSNLSY